MVLTRALRARFRIATAALALVCVVVIACTPSRPIASAPRVSVGAPFVLEAPASGAPYAANAFPARTHGKIDLTLVAAEVKRRLPALEACWDRRLAAAPSLSGTVVIHWFITESGEVPDACVTKDTVGDRELADCVNRLVREGGPFPAPRGGSIAAPRRGAR